MAKLSKEDWVRQGFKLLEKEGYQAIKLENLCDKFYVTRGSFYHHFTGISEYILDILKYWETDTLDRISVILRDNKEPAGKFALFINFIYSVSGKTEISFRMWAIHDKLVRKYVSKVDNERMILTASLYRQLGVPENRAVELSKLGYIMWLGVMSFHLYNEKEKNSSVESVSRLFANIRQIVLNT